MYTLCSANGSEITGTHNSFKSEAAAIAYAIQRLPSDNTCFTLWQEGKASCQAIIFQRMVFRPSIIFRPSIDEGSV